MKISTVITKKDSSGKEHVLCSAILLFGNKTNGEKMDMIPYFISLTEVPQNGDLVFADGYGVWEFKDETGHGSAPMPYWANKNTCKKILVTPDYMSKEILRDILEGKIREMDEVLIECDEFINQYNEKGKTNDKCFKLNKPDGYIVLFPKEEFVTIQALVGSLVVTPDQLKESNWEDVERIMFNRDASDGTKSAMIRERYYPPIKKNVVETESKYKDGGTEFFNSVNWDKVGSEYLESAFREQNMPMNMHFLEWLKSRFNSPTKK